MSLNRYLNTPETVYRWTLLEKSARLERLKLTALEWQGFVWEHEIVLVKSPSKSRQETVLLYVTGGEPNPLDISEAESLSDLSGLSVALLFQIPNQPLFELTEDDLIAHTFVRFIETGEESWPLLLPMVKSGVAAMDALQEHRPKVREFVVTGGSKRGWTAWLLAATGDPRVAGIAPMVFDNLNVSAQLQHQLRLWGRHSEMIEPYTTLELHKAVHTDQGQRLLATVDPFSYLKDLKQPKLIVNGANDPYWTVDALNHYWDALSEPKWASIVPNAGHMLGDKKQAIQAIAAFSKSVADKKPLPTLKCEWETDSIRVASDTSPVAARLWTATSESLNFTESEWRISLEVGHGGRTGAFETSLKLPHVSGPMAFFAELEFPNIKLSSPARIV